MGWGRGGVPGRPAAGLVAVGGRGGRQAMDGGGRQAMRWELGGAGRPWDGSWGGRQAVNWVGRALGVGGRPAVERVGGHENDPAHLNRMTTSTSSEPAVKSAEPQLWLEGGGGGGYGGGGVCVRVHNHMAGCVGYESREARPPLLLGWGKGVTAQHGRGERKPPSSRPTDAFHGNNIRMHSKHQKDLARTSTVSHDFTLVERGRAKGGRAGRKPAPRAHRRQACMVEG